MRKVDIYLEADSKAQKNTERKCAYILETICAGAIKTAEGFQCISGTYHSATLIGQFTRYIHMALVVGDKILVVGSKAICLQVDA